MEESAFSSLFNSLSVLFFRIRRPDALQNSVRNTAENAVFAVFCNLHSPIFASFHGFFNIFHNVFLRVV